MAAPVAPRVAGTPIATARRVQLLAFAGLTVFGATFWALLMRPAPFGRMLACAGLALAVIVAAEHTRALPRAARIAARVLIAVAFGALVLLVAGVRLRLLAPAH